MRKTNRGCWWSVLSVALFFAMAFLFSACDVQDIIGPGGPDDPAPQQLSMLKAQGADVVNAEGDTVYLRGVNAGGLFVIEQWMNGFQSSTYSEEVPIVARDYRTTTEVFLQRFGKEETQKLWEIYRENWWSEEDFDRCEALGVNVIRLPFTYMNVDFDAIESYNNAGKQYDFSALDAFVEAAAERNIYTILDMHGAYGSQNGQDHSGQTLSREQVDFYENSQMIELTRSLWKALAEHYKDNPAIAGYDILNEPGEKAGETEERHFIVFDKIYRSIREVDQNHIVIFESCWEGRNLPHPDEYDWKNCMYSFHHYTGCASGGQYMEHAVSWNEKIEAIAKEDFGVPLFMGEFTCYNDAEQWEYCLGLLNALGWHWTSWTYKINNTWDNSAWGIFSVPAKEKVNAHTDSFEEIARKFSLLKTTESIHETDLGGRLLKDILKEACGAQPALERGEREYRFTESESGCRLFTDGERVILSEDRYGYTPFTVTPHPSGDGSFYIRFGRTYMTVGTGYTVFAQRSESLPSDASRFLLVPAEYGYVLYSYSSCRAVKIGSDGMLTADAGWKDAAVFDLGIIVSDV